ncbi:MAG: glycosyltransferase family 2 protein [Leeuwenhoekiella sp.]
MELQGQPTNGTLTVIQTQTLKEIGGWPTVSITEDAQLGIRLLEENKTISYVSKVIGKGLAPTRPKDLATQRERWIFGNVQNLAYLFKSKKLNLKRKIFLAPQLLSWINFRLPSYLLLLLSTAGMLFSVKDGELIAVTFKLTLLTLLLSHISKFLPYWKAEQSLRRAWSGYLVNYAMEFQSAIYWLSYFINPLKPFKRTSKSNQGFLPLQDNIYIIVPILIGGIALSFTSFGLWGATLIAYATFLLYATYALNTSAREIHRAPHPLEPVTL